MTDVLVTTYSDPDLDGTGCSVAYAEFLRKNGRDAVAGVFGEPDEEAGFELEKLSLELRDARDVVGDVDEIVLVDASNLDWLNESIDESKISEMIDHREHNLSENFDADPQIELVGAAATLIAEKFRDSDIEISKDSAEMLYTAIADNTVNFQANVTTERDMKAAEWLKQVADLDERSKQKVFEIKSDTEGSVSRIVEQDYYHTELAGKTVGIAQLEIMDLENFVEHNLEDILSKLENLEQRDELDHVFLTGVDIQTGKISSSLRIEKPEKFWRKL